MTAFLAAGTTALASDEFTLASGESATLFLIDAAGPVLPDDAYVDIQIKSDGGQFFNIGRLTKMSPFYVLTAVGTFRLYRHACRAAVGVDKN